MNIQKEPLSIQQQHYFREKLEKLRREVLEEARRILETIRQETQEQDPDNKAARETQWITECSLLNHEQATLHALDAALERIQNGVYGLCEDTDIPIPLDRLKASPTAVLSIQAQNKLEQNHPFRLHPPL
jgi:DnaK suppressor protein